MAGAQPRRDPPETPIVEDAGGSPANDEAALNGGDARHWYASAERETRRPPMLTARVVTAVAIFGGLALALVVLAGSA